jgi:hypothetical protein
MIPLVVLIFALQSKLKKLRNFDESEGVNMY